MCKAYYDKGKAGFYAGEGEKISGVTDWITSVIGLDAALHAGGLGVRVKLVEHNPEVCYNTKARTSLYHNAISIAADETDCDQEIVALSALLHDVDDHKLCLLIILMLHRGLQDEAEAAGKSDT